MPFWRTNEDSPCRDCPKREPACSGHCPIEAEGGYGYDSWRSDVEMIKKKRAQYIRQHNEDYKRSEEYEYKNRRKRG